MDNSINISINQTATYLIANNQTNYSVYHIKPFEKFMSSQSIENVNNFEIKYIKMYYSSNILIIIGKSKVNDASGFLIYDAESKNILNEEIIDENKLILSVEINRTNIFVLCEDCIIVYGFPINIKLDKLDKSIIRLEKSAKNMAISQYPLIEIIAYSDSNKDIYIHHLSKNKIIKIENAHDQDITSLRFNYNATILASGSLFGKKIRLWNTNDGNTIKELKTSFQKYSISSMDFSPDSLRFCCVSVKGHLDFYNLEEIIDVKYLEYTEKKNKEMNTLKEIIKGKKIKDYQSMKNIDNIGASVNNFVAFSSNNDILLINIQNLEMREIYINQKEIIKKSSKIFFN